MKDAGDNIFLYTSDAIQSHPKVSLTREGLFLWAILNGGDYDTVCFLFIHGVFVLSTCRLALLAAAQQLHTSWPKVI